MPSDAAAAAAKHLTNSVNVDAAATSPADSAQHQPSYISIERYTTLLAKAAKPLSVPTATNHRTEKQKQKTKIRGVLLSVLFWCPRLLHKAAALTILKRAHTFFFETALHGDAKGTHTQ